jgi:hypothetical protein
MIPAAVLDTFFRNCLRVGMAVHPLFADFDFRFDRPDGPTYTPKATPWERSYSFLFAWNRPLVRQPPVFEELASSLNLQGSYPIAL